MSGFERSWEDVKNKLSSLKSAAKKKNAARKRELVKTGGGPAPDPLTQREINILDFMGETVVNGIAGGIETPLFPYLVADGAAGGDGACNAKVRL